MAEGLTSLEIDQLHRNCSEIADLADGLKEILGTAFEGDSKATVITVILNHIISLAEVYV